MLTQKECGSMKKKCCALSLWSFVLAVVTFAVTYFVYHYVKPEGQITAYRSEIGKPMVTLLLSQLGTMFLFVSIFSRGVACIVFGGEKTKKES